LKRKNKQLCLLVFYLAGIFFIFACDKKAEGLKPMVPFLSDSINKTAWSAKSFQNWSDSEAIHIIGYNDTSQLQISLPLGIKPGTYKMQFALHFTFIRNKIEYIGSPDSIAITSNASRIISGQFKISLISRYGEPYAKVTGGSFYVTY